jgi:hypothetical protein
MRYDRILSSILEFINNYLWSRELPEKKAKPYERIRTWHLASRGILHQVNRPPDLCPRAVATFIYEPLRLEGSPRDLHFCIDHLEGMSAPIRPGSSSRFRATHRITVLEASHWVGADGRYDASELFSLDDDLQGQSRRDGFAACILYQMAVATSGQVPIRVNWKLELHNAKKVCMGAQFTNTIDITDPGHDDIIAYDPVTGRPGARIRLPILLWPVLLAWMPGLDRRG